MCDIECGRCPSLECVFHVVFLTFLGKTEDTPRYSHPKPCVLNENRVKTNSTTQDTMSKQDTDSTPDKDADSVLVEAARNGDATAVRVGLEKLAPDTDSTTVAFDAAHEACRGNHDECLTLLLPYIETTQMGFGILLSECVHADHTACTGVLLQHWKSVCSNVAFVPLESKESHTCPCPAMWGDPVVCQVLIDAGADVNTKVNGGRSPLHLACGSGRLATVKMLVEAGAGVRVADGQENDGFMLAASFGHIEIVRYIVSLPDWDVNHRYDFNNHTALHFAAVCPQSDALQVLIDAGADIDAKDDQGQAPLHYASRSGQVANVAALVRAGAALCVVDSKWYTCLFVAVHNGHTDAVRYLAGLPEVDVNHRGIRGLTALHYALEKQHSDVTQVLIDAGADVDAKLNDGRSLLALSSSAGILEDVKTLVEAGARVQDTDNEGYTCLLLAAHNGHTETVRYLVGLQGVDVNHRGRDDCTALQLAVQAKHTGVVRVLIDAGADISSMGFRRGVSPLYTATMMGHVEIVKMLVKAGAGVRDTDAQGNTCLFIAAINGRTETVRYLVSLPEVDVNHRDINNHTVLELASVKKQTGVRQVLIDAGAHTTKKERQCLIS